MSAPGFPIDRPAGRTPAATAGTLAQVSRLFREPLEATRLRVAAELDRLPEADALAGFVAGGKMLRPLMAFLSCAAAGGDPDNAVPAAAAVELLHTASLIHDDIIDRSDTRRGRSALHRTVGEGPAIALGDALLAGALGVLADDPATAADTILLVRRTQECCRGQVVELRDAPAMTPAACLGMMRDKTGALFAAAAELGGRAAGADAGSVAALGRFGTEFGVAFQIYDDLLDLLAPPGAIGKPTGRSLNMVRPMLPLVLLKARTPPSVWGPLFEAPTRERTLDVLGGCGALAETLAHADRTVAEGRAALEVLPATPYRTILAEMIGQARGACDALLVAGREALTVD